MVQPYPCPSIFARVVLEAVAELLQMGKVFPEIQVDLLSISIRLFQVVRVVAQAAPAAERLVAPTTRSIKMATRCIWARCLFI